MSESSRGLIWSWVPICLLVPRRSSHVFGFG